MHSYRQDEADVAVRHAPISDSPSHELLVGDISGLQAALDLKTTTASLIYRALITQSGTGDPTVKVLQNTLSDAIVWTRSVGGGYVGTLALAFTANKTFCTISGVSGFATFVRTSADVVTLSTTNTSAAAADTLLTDNPIQILVYP